MLQNYYKSDSYNDMFQVFTGVVNNTDKYDIRIWNKPKNCQFVHIFCVGGGGGGGGGASNATTAGGGGGGGPGSIGYFFSPAYGVPDVLYVRVGHGGKGGTGGVSGGAAATAGSQGGYSYVATIDNPGLATIQHYRINQGGYGTGGGAGTTTSGSGGSGFTAGYPSYQGIASVSFGLGVQCFGKAGSVSSNAISCRPIGFPIDGAQNTYGNTITQGGGGGGGALNSPFLPSSSAFDGGGIEISGVLSSIMGLSTPILPGGTGGSLPGNGFNGYNYNYNFTNIDKSIKEFLLVSTGGSGGGGCNASGKPGGDGGNAGFGSGGGGGGATLGGTGIRGGNGGDGGPGLVIISCY